MTIRRFCISHFGEVPVIIFALALSSCAPTAYEVTSGLLDQGKNDDAIANARANLARNPNDPLFLKYLGIGLYNKKYYGDATAYFERSLSADPEDDQAVYYLASSYEASVEYEKAIQYYRRYREMTVFGEYRDIVDARVKILYRQEMQIEAKKALLEESHLDVASVPPNTLAVLYFENKGNMRNLDPLQKGIADMMITDLSKIHSVKVVERVRLQKLVEELNFGESGLVDERTAPRVGKLLGAYRLVKGTFFDLTSDKLRIDALVAQTRSGQVDGTTDISGDMKQFFRLEKELVFKILDELKIPITNQERVSILEVPTENFFAFLQYSQGIDYEDKGLYDQAVQSYTSAVQSDPNFSQARSSLSTAKKTGEMMKGGASTSGSNAVPTQSVPPPPSSTLAKESIGGMSERASSTSTNVNSGFVPGPSSSPQPTSVVTPLPEPPKPPK